jgi:hypothetical protein
VFGSVEQEHQFAGYCAAKFRVLDVSTSLPLAISTIRHRAHAQVYSLSLILSLFINSFIIMFLRYTCLYCNIICVFMYLFLV